MNDETPMGTLIRLGIRPSGWANNPGTSTLHKGEPVWDIHAPWLNSHAIRDLAFLITEGWEVKVAHADRGALRIRIQRPLIEQETA